MSSLGKRRLKVHFPPIPEEQEKALVREWVEMVRAACRRGEPLLGNDAQLLEQVLTEVKHEYDEARDEIDLVTHARDEARVEIKRMQEWIVQCRPVLTCDRNTGCGKFTVFDGESEKGVPYWGEPDPKDDCGECVPCKARAALKGD